MNKISAHKALCEELHQIYISKNKDYGDSFGKTFQEEGVAMARIRLSDKLNRFKTLTKSEKGPAVNESVKDTLIDLANYALMTAMELDIAQDKAEPGRPL